MGYTFNLTIPAAGGGSRPVNVSGQTLLSCPTGDLQIAYDENGFNTAQFFTLTGAAAPQVLMFPSSGKALLWIRLDPDGGAPATTLNVWTDIGQVNA
jgi:hypothetical protein